MSFKTWFGRGLRALVPLLAVAGLAFATAAPATAADIVMNKQIQLYVVPDLHWEKNCAIVKQVRDGQVLREFTKIINPGRWNYLDINVGVFEQYTFTITPSLGGACLKPYKEFIAVVPADDLTYFWVDATRYPLR